MNDLELFSFVKIQFSIVNIPKFRNFGLMNVIFTKETLEKGFSLFNTKFFIIVSCEFSPSNTMLLLTLKYGELKSYSPFFK